MVYSILTTKGERAKDIDGEITPVFEYPIQAQQYIIKKCVNSPYLSVVNIKNKEKVLTTREADFLMNIKRKLTYCKVCKKPIVNRGTNAKYCKFCALIKQNGK